MTEIERMGYTMNVLPSLIQNFIQRVNFIYYNPNRLQTAIQKQECEKYLGRMVISLKELESFDFHTVEIAGVRKPVYTSHNLYINEVHESLKCVFEGFESTLNLLYKTELDRFYPDLSHKLLVLECRLFDLVLYDGTQFYPMSKAIYVALYWTIYIKRFNWYVSEVRQAFEIALTKS